MVVFTEVSSMKTRLDVSSRPCCRIQCRRARATSGRCCSAARRLFFEADAVALQKTPERATAAGYSLLAQGHDELFECPLRPFRDQPQNRVRMVLQRRPAPAARLRRASALPLPRLKPFDRRGGTDIKTLRCLTPRRSLFNRVDHPVPQIPRTSLGHGPPPHSEPPQDSADPPPTGIPDSIPPGTALGGRTQAVSRAAHRMQKLAAEAAVDL